jgi:hypothetical protein
MRCIEFLRYFFQHSEFQNWNSDFLIIQQWNSKKIPTRSFGIKNGIGILLPMGVPEIGTKNWNSQPRTRPTYIYGDNKSQVTNSSRKKCNSICCHTIQESVAMGESLVTHIRTGENLADFLTKATSGSKHRKLVSGVVHDIYTKFPKQLDSTWQDQLTDPDHLTDLERTDKI